MPIFEPVKNLADEQTKIAAHVVANKLSDAHIALKKALVALSKNGLLNLSDPEYCEQLTLIHDAKRFSKAFTDEETIALDKFLDAHRDKIFSAVNAKNQESLSGDLSFLDNLDEQVIANTASDTESPGRISPVLSEINGQKTNNSHVVVPSSLTRLIHNL